MHALKKYGYIFYFFCAVLFVGCEEEVPEDNFNATENFNRTIQFDVSVIYNISPLLDSMVPGATVNIYDNYYDFIYEAWPAASRVTDSLGHCAISGLDQDYYYIRAKHPSFADITDSVSTPAYTTSFVEMIFYE